MKKKLFSVMAMATALFVASCSNDDFEQNMAGDEAQVSFSISLDDVATRAIGDGAKCDKLVWEVYDSKGVRVDGVSDTREPAFTNGLTETVEITLAKGQTYTFAFWAQDKECEAYTTTNLQRIEIDYAKLYTNDDKGDAFFGNTEPITVTQDFDHTVILKRPFAQLNLGVSDLDEAIAAGVTLDQVKVKISELAANLNAKTGTVEGALADVELSLEDILYKDGTGENEMLQLKNPLTQGGEDEFPWMSMNYILVNDAPTGAARTTAAVTFTLTTDEADIVLNSPYTPLQRNWRTNIIAKLTSVGTFNVVIDPIFDGEENGTIDGDNKVEFEEYGVKGATGELYKTLGDALKAGESDILLADGEHILPGLTKTVKITGASTAARIKYPENQIAIGMNGADATFENVTIVGVNVNYSGYQHAGNVTYNGCVIENQIFCYSAAGDKSVFNDCTFNQESADWYNIWTYGANVDFNNCVFNSAGKAVLVYTEGGNVWETVNFKDCKFYASQKVTDKAAIEIDSSLNPCNVNIEGCTATGFDNGSVSGNSLYNLKKGEEGVNCNISVVFADGVNVVKGVYEISNANGMFWFANEVNVNQNSFAGKIVKLTADIDLKNALWSPIGQTGQKYAIFRGVFDGNSKTIKNLNVDERANNETYHGAGLFGWFEGNGPVVKDLTIDGAEVYGHHYAAAVIAYCEEGGIITNVTVKNAKIHCVFNTVKKDDGDKAGAIVGYLRGSVDECHAEDCAIDAVRDAGQIAGASEPTFVTNCTATRVSVIHNNSAAGYNESKDGWRIAERLIGYDTTRTDNH